MVFCNDPYFNEPGYEASAGSAHGDRANAAYNANLHQATAQHAMLTPLTKPNAGPHGVFAELLAQHFKAKGGEIKAQLRRWKLSKQMQAAVAAPLDQL